MRRPYHLRPSEIRFLKPIAGGYTIEETAKILGITTATAYTHADNIRAQLNLHKIETAALLALIMGYFSPHDIPFKFKNPAAPPWCPFPSPHNRQRWHTHH